jgi:hypothetical protein
MWIDDQIVREREKARDATDKIRSERRYGESDDEIARKTSEVIVRAMREIELLRMRRDGLVALALMEADDGQKGVGK